MAEEEAAKPEPAQKSGAAVTWAIVAAVALLEGAGFFVFLKFFGGGPGVSHGASSAHVVAPEPQPQEPSSVEVVVLQRFRVPNSKSGQTLIYDFDLSVVVPASRKAEMEQAVKNRFAEISDRVSQTIRQSSPRVLGEDDFTTLRQLLKQNLDEIARDNQLIQRVLIPRCVPLKTD